MPDTSHAGPRSKSNAIGISAMDGPLAEYAAMIERKEAAGEDASYLRKRYGHLCRTRDQSAAEKAKLATQARSSDSAKQGTEGEPRSYLDQLRAALVDTDGLDGIPDPQPLIGPNILFQDSIAWVVGKPGCGKSFVLLDMAGCVATGNPWQGYPVTSGPVLYLVAEGVRGTKKRVRAWERAMGTPMAGVHFLPIAVQAANEGAWNALVELAVELRPVLVVVDTQARVTIGLEENSNTEMGHFVALVDRLRAATDACVVLVHHIGRNGDTGRGATVLDGALSTIIKITKDEDQITLEFTKQKDDEEPDDIRLRTVPMEESLILALDSGLGRRTTGASEAALKAARTWWDHHADAWVGSTGLVDVVAPRTSLYRHVRELESERLVVADKTGRYPRYRLLRQP